MSEATESQVIIDTAIRGAAPVPLDAKRGIFSVIVPEGGQQCTIDLGLEQYLDAPPRVKGTTVLHDAVSLVDLVKEHEWEATKVYADLGHFRFTAVFNGAWKSSPETDSEPGWSDHRSQLTLTKTPEWLHWESRNGQSMSQTAFAEHVEDGLAEIVEPAAAEMLELAQTFHANTGVAFKSSTILASGQRQLHYEETTTARAGQKGDITIPQEFVLGVAPFEGSPAYRVTARFRFSVREGTLSIGYKLDRPHVVLRSAFDDTVGEVAEAVESPVFRGVAPDPIGD